MTLRAENITENFTVEELNCKCGCGWSIIQYNLVHRLQVIRDIAEEPIKVLSGGRCATHNLAVGGTPGSYHLKGEAVDWCLASGNKVRLKWLAELLKDWSGGFHYYEDRGFIHCDIGRRRRW